MSECCSDPAAAAEADARCPNCGERGREVERITLLALLTPAALMRLTPARYRFCPTTTCDLVYFGPQDAYRRIDVLFPVFQKEPSSAARVVCYCFVVTEGDMAREIREAGHSGASNRITALVQAGRCACEVRNPQGSCCLGNIAGVVRRLATADAEAPPGA